MQLRLPPAPDLELLRCRPEVAITDEERAILDQINGLYNTMMARVKQCQTSYMPTINRVREELGPVADLEAARQQLVGCVTGHVEQYNQAVLEQHQLLSELCAQLNAPPPPEPETPPLEVNQRAQAGFGASGLLMVLALAGGGYAAWKLLSRKKKG
jgi:hypothetical protein